MAIGRISGSMLKSNLTRNGVDLAFETNILYLDVTNARVGIGTSSPSTTLQVNGTTTTTGLVAGGLTYPTADGSNGQVLTTNGSGTLSFTSLSGFNGITFVGDDSTGSTINTAETLKFAGGNNITTSVSNDTVTITGSTSINVNEISSADSSAVQINDNVNVSGTLNAKTIVTNDLISEDSTAINVLDGLNVTGDLSISGGDITVPSGNLTITTPTIGTQLILNPNGSAVDIGNQSGLGVIVMRDYTYFYKGLEIIGNLTVNSIASGDSSAIQINDALNVSGTLSADVLDVNEISSSDSSAIQINDSVNISGTLSTDVIDVNEISSGDSTAIQINDSVNIAGVLSMNGNKISNMSDPTANQDAATKKYVDDQIIGSGSGTVVSITAGTGLTASPANPITTSGTISLDFSTVVARVVGDDSTGTDLSVGETIKIAGGNNITTAVSGDTLTVTGSKDIDVNSISSSDSTAIQINDAVNVSGTFTANTIQTNSISSSESSAVQINDGLNVSGTLTANTIQTNELSSTESTAIQVNDSLNASGTITASSFVTHGTSGNITGVNNIEVNQISSNDSTAVQVADGMNVSGTLTAPTFVTNDISSGDSTAIQVNDGLNVSGTLTANSGLVANGITYPTTDGTTNQVLVTNGSGVLSFTSLSGFTGITFVGDDSTGSTINTAETLKFSGATGITTSVVGDVVTITGPDLTPYAQKTDTAVNIVGDDSTGTAITIGETFKIAGTQNITTAVSGDTLTITGPNLSNYLQNTGPQTIDNLIFDDNIISTSSNANLLLSPGGTGEVSITPGGNQFQFKSDGTLRMPGALNFFQNIDIPLGAPVAGGANDRVRLWDFDGTGSNFNYAIGAEGNHIWFSMDVNDGTGGFKFYSRDNQVFKIRDDGALVFDDGSIQNTAAAFTVVGDDSTGVTLNAGETIKIAGTQNVSTAVSGDTLTITGPDLTNYTQKTDKAITIVGDDSTGTDVTIGETFKIAGGTGITTSVSGDTITINGANQAQGITVVGDDSTGTQIGDGETLKIAGTQNVTTAMSGDTLTITGPDLSSYATTTYVDNKVSANNTLTVADDTSTTIGIELDNTLRVIGATGISTSVSGDTLTITGPDLSGYLTSVPKIIDVNEISSSDSTAIQINDAVNIAGVLSVGGNVISNVSDPVANQDAATKNYVDSQLSSITTTFYVEDDTSTVATIDSGDTLRIIGSGGITTAVSGDTLTITGANQAQGITFFDDNSTSTAIPDGGTLQITSGQGISTSILGNVITITNTSTQLEIDGGSAYSVYNAISEALIDGGSA